MIPREKWSHPLPDHIPESTYAPAILALGLVMTAAGLVTDWFVSAIGLAVTGAGIHAWIGGIRRERRHP